MYRCLSKDSFNDSVSKIPQEISKTTSMITTGIFSSTFEGFSSNISLENLPVVALAEERFFQKLFYGSFQEFFQWLFWESSKSSYRNASKNCLRHYYIYCLRNCSKYYFRNIVRDSLKSVSSCSLKKSASLPENFLPETSWNS